jgi:hypothetical protein
VFEESVEGFIARWRQRAADGHAFARAEGSPLLEVLIAGSVLQLFERTGPYDAPAGGVRLIVHGVVAGHRTAPDVGSHLTPIAPGRFALAGTIVEREAPFAVVDVDGVPVVLAIDGAAPWPPVGTRVACETLPPAQAFVLRRSARTSTPPTDEQV